MKNKVLIAAVAIIGLASVAYASFTQLLTINGTGTATGSWDVKITGITRTSATGVTDASAPLPTHQQHLAQTSNTLVQLLPIA